MDSITAKLERLGLSPYESKATIALLKKHPCNGYQVGKIAGIPISKVYDVLARLKSKGVVTVDESASPALYYPVSAHSIVGKIRLDYDTTLRELENDLKLISPIPAIDPSWNIMGYEAVMQKAAAVLKGARKTAMLSVWRPEHERLRPEIRRAEKRGATVVISAFGAARVQGRYAIRMNSCGDTSRKRIGARLMVVVADSREVAISTITNAAQAVGIITTTPQVVLVAKEYIRHDVWGRILIDEIGEERFKQLCKQNELLAFLIANQ